MAAELLVLVVAGCLISAVIKQYCKEFLLLFQLALVLALLLIIYNNSVDKITAFADIIRSLTGGSNMFNTLLKSAVITVLTKIACDICRDSNNLLIEGVVELGGRLAIFVLAFPYILNIISISLEFL